MADTEDLQESSFVEKGRGKWGKGGVPHKGWKCVDVEDLGEPHFWWLVSHIPSVFTAVTAEFRVLFKAAMNKKVDN